MKTLSVTLLAGVLLMLDVTVSVAGILTMGLGADWGNWPGENIKLPRTSPPK